MKIVIFAGGVGSRLWPLSRKNSPKQFEKILGDQSTLQLAASRLQPDFPWENLYVATGNTYVDIVKEQLPDILPSHVIGEPVRRDVGPAVGLITAILAKDFPTEPMAILWSDHLVRKEEHFRHILKTAGDIALDDPNKIIFVAQKPRFASQNLGWIHHGEQAFTKNGISFYSFVDFQYRPDSPTAQRYFESKTHAWNLGYFVTTPQFLWKQFEKYTPELFKTLSKIQKAWNTDSFQQVLQNLYPTLEAINFDNAILEKLDQQDALVASENIEWSDIGAWEALKEALSSSNDDNVTKGDVALDDTRDSLIYNFGKQLVVGIDLENYIVVNTSDVVLVAPKTSVGKIKKFVEKLEGTKHEHLA